MNCHQVRIDYGRGSIPLTVDPSRAKWRILKPRQEPSLPDPHESFRTACRNPIGCSPIKTIIRPHERVVIVTSDGTRPLPNRLLVEWLLEELCIPPANVTLLLGNGTHRPNTQSELISMFGEEIVRSISIVNHDAYDLSRNECIGKAADGADVIVDSLYLNADRRIVLGFIEPHLFAGFSGGAKGVFPGVAGIGSILHLHRADLIADPMSTWGVLDENPIQHEIREMVGACPPDFIINVTLNARKEITGFYAGQYLEAHARGCEQVWETAMVPVERRFPIVVTSNSGFPLDQNLYQTVKGISAAARIVEPGGIIVAVSECCDGVPEDGRFAQLLQGARSAHDLCETIFRQPRTVLDQWQAQILGSILQRARVALRSSIPRDRALACHLEPIDDLDVAIEEELRRRGNDLSIGVLPHGPQTIPCVSAFPVHHLKVDSG